jgi:hypothetical protein
MVRSGNIRVHISPRENKKTGLGVPLFRPEHDNNQSSVSTGQVGIPFDEISETLYVASS